MQELVLPNFDLMNNDELRKYIFDVENFLLTQPQAELPLKHHFSNGVYARELHIPANCILTGKVHKFENLNILSKGKISLISQDGVMTVEAPFTVVSTPGVKRLAFAHTDCVWTTILGTDSKDHVEIEDKFTTNNYNEIEVKACHSQLQP